MYRLVLEHFLYMSHNEASEEEIYRSSRQTGLRGYSEATGNIVGDFLVVQWEVLGNTSFPLPRGFPLAFRNREI